MSKRKVRIIDLSIPMRNQSFGTGFTELTFAFWDHREGALYYGRQYGIDPNDFPDGMAQAWEDVIGGTTHAGTHLDAPWHFGPTVEGKPAKTIDQIPLEWCHGDGVVLDFRYKKDGEAITVEDIKKELERINYKIKPFDIVLFMTGRDKYEHPEYYNMIIGPDRDAVLWVIDQGVKVMGSDAAGFEYKGIKYMLEDNKKGIKGALWQAHCAGREKEYCHIEKLTNLDKITKPYGFQVACFPTKIAKGSAGWTRAVAILEEEE